MRWTDVTRPASPRVLRQFAGLWIACWLGVGAWEYAMHDRPATGIVCLAAALLVGPMGLVRPSLIRPVFTGWMMAAFPIGWTVSRLVLAVVFFGVVTPIGLVFRLLGRDRLERRRPSGRRSLWQPKPAASPRSYFRQF